MRWLLLASRAPSGNAHMAEVPMSEESQEGIDCSRSTRSRRKKKTSGSQRGGRSIHPSNTGSGCIICYASLSCARSPGDGCCLPTYTRHWGDCLRLPHYYLSSTTNLSIRLLNNNTRTRFLPCTFCITAATAGAAPYAHNSFSRVDPPPTRHKQAGEACLALPCLALPVSVQPLLPLRAPAPAPEPNPNRRQHAAGGAAAVGAADNGWGGGPPSRGGRQ